MTLKINYELIYKVRAAGVRTDCLSNLEVQYTNKARDEARKVHGEYVALLKKLLGTDDFEVTNVACMADGIIGHVYSPHWNQHTGVGHRVCVFCGCDDFDF